MRTVGGAARAVDVPARQRAQRRRVDLHQRDRVVVEVDGYAREVVAVLAPHISAQLREDVQRLARMHEPPHLINEMTSPIVESSATERGLVAPVRPPLLRRWT